MTIEQHLLSRGVDPSLYSVHLDNEEDIATFMLYNLAGQHTGYQQYRPGRMKSLTEARKLKIKPRELRYFTHSAEYRRAFFGAEQFVWENPKLFLVEGVFDAVKLHALGHNCFAVFTKNPLDMRHQFAALPHEKIGVLDGDTAGSELAYFCDRYVTCPAGMDAGDLTTQQLSELLQHVLN